MKQINKHRWLAPNDALIPNRSAVHKMRVASMKVLLEDISKGIDNLMCYN